MKPIDHTHCFADRGELSSDLIKREFVSDPRVYGLFRPFRPYITNQSVVCWIEKVRTVSEAGVRDIVEAIPGEWQVDRRARDAVVILVVERARFVADTLLGALCSLLERLWLP